MTQEKRDTIAGIQLSYAFELQKYESGFYGKVATLEECRSLVYTYNLMGFLIAHPQFQGEEGEELHRKYIEQNKQEDHE